MKASKCIFVIECLVVEIVWKDSLWLFLVPFYFQPGAQTLSVRHERLVFVGYLLALFG